MPGSETVKLLNMMQANRWFSVQEADERLFEHWESGRPWADEDIRLIVKDFEAVPTAAATRQTGA